jgi:hypothetical protein
MVKPAYSARATRSQSSEGCGVKCARCLVEKWRAQPAQHVHIETGKSEINSENKAVLVPFMREHSAKDERFLMRICAQNCLCGVRKC